MTTRSHIKEFQDIIRMVLRNCVKPDIQPQELIGSRVMAYCHDQESEAEYGGMALFTVTAVLHNAHKIMFAHSDGIFLEYSFDLKGWFFIVHGHRFPADCPEFDFSQGIERRRSS